MFRGLCRQRVLCREQEADNERLGYLGTHNEKAKSSDIINLKTYSRNIE